MPEGAFLPPWLQPADPAAHMATGLQIGVRIGAEQAAQQLQQAQMLRQEQIQAQEQARWQAEFGLREAEAKRTAEAAARKSAAIAAYQQEVASGADPLSAILRYGPAMQEPGSAMAAAYRSMIPRKQVQPKIPKWVPPDPETGQPGMLVDESTGSLLAHYPLQKDTTGELSASDREQLRSDRAIISTFEKNYGGMEGVAAKRMDPEGYKAALSEVQQAADSILSLQPNDPQASRYSTKKSAAPIQGALRFVRDPQTGQLVMEGQPAAPSSPTFQGDLTAPNSTAPLPPPETTLGSNTPAWLRAIGQAPILRPLTDQFIPPTQ